MVLSLFGLGESALEGKSSTSLHLYPYFRIMIVILLFAVFGIFLLKKLVKTDGLGAFDLSVAWVLKFGMSFLFMVIYTYYYGTGTLSSDIGVFMEESKILHDVSIHSFFDYLKFLFGQETPEMIQKYLSKTDHWSSGDLILINDAQNVMRVNSLLYFVSNGNVYFHMLVFSFLSTLGLRELYLAFYKRIWSSKRFFFYAILLIPSVAFWTASILKEPLMMLGFSMILRSLFGEIEGRKKWFKLILGSFLMLLFKPYVFFILLIAIVFLLLSNQLFKKRMIYTVLVGIIVFFSFFTIQSPANTSITNFLSRKQYDFINVSQGGLHVYADSCFYYFTENQYKYFTFYGNHHVRLNRALKAKKLQLGSVAPSENVYLVPTGKLWINYYSTELCSSFIPITQINNSSSQLIKNIPEAFINAAFRPFFGDPGGNLKYFNILETFSLFGWFFFTLFYFRKRRTFEDNQLIWFIVVFSVLLFLLIGFTTPVLGAIARYRIPAYLMIFIASLMGSKNKQLT